MVKKELVLLGGGHSHVEVLRAFGYNRRQLQAQLQQPQQQHTSFPNLKAPPPGPSPPSQQHTADGAGGKGGDGDDGAVRLTLVSRGRFTPYSGMLPGWASGFYSYHDCHIDLGRLAAYAGARLVTAEATGLDVKARQVLFGDGRPPQPYDVLSVDVGITPGVAAIPGADQHTVPVKPIDGFVMRYKQLLERYRASAEAAAALEASTSITESQIGPAAPLMRVCVVGGGAGGVELAAAVRHRLEEERRLGGWSAEGRGGVAVSLVCRGGLLPGHPPHVRRLVGGLLTQRGVEVRAGNAVVGVGPGELLLQGGERWPYDECLWCTEASPAAWLRQTGLPTDERGFLAVNENLQSDGGPQEVFAAGDVATCTTQPRPKAGVYAVRQGPPLAANLRSFLLEEPLQAFKPQATAMALISLGDRFCVASRTGGPPPQRTRSEVHGAGSPGINVRNGSGDGDDGDEWPLGWLLNGCGGLAAGLTGPLLWRWKDSIDRAFMRRYGEALPLDEHSTMAAASVPESAVVENIEPAKAKRTEEAAKAPGEWN